MFQRRVSLVAVSLLTTSVAFAQGETRELEAIPSEPPLGPNRAFLRGLRDHDFPAIDKQLQELAKKGRAEGDYVHALDRVVDCVAERPETEADLNAWVAAMPKSPFALLARGRFLVKHGWRARGSGWASTVPEDGWKVFGARLELARRDLETVRKLAPKLPYPLYDLLTIARGISVDEPVCKGWFDAAVALDPSYLRVYASRLNYLMPKWHGSEEEMFDFARATAKARPDEPALGILLATAYLETARYGGVDGPAYLKSAEVARDVKRIFDAIEKKYPKAFDAVDRKLELLAIVRDGETSRTTMETAAKAGHPSVLFRLSDLHFTGKAGSKDLPLSRHESLEAARGENAPALFILAHALHQGEDAPKNVAAALAWYRAASELGDARADLNGGLILLSGGPGVGRDPTAAAAWFRRGLERGHAGAAASYAQLMIEGNGVPKDEAAGWKLMERAAAAGDEWAKKRVRDHGGK